MSLLSVNVLLFAQIISFLRYTDIYKCQLRKNWREGEREEILLGLAVIVVRNYPRNVLAFAENASSSFRGRFVRGGVEYLLMLFLSIG